VADLIPFSTTTIQISREPQTTDVDPGDTPPGPPAIIATGVRAVISVPNDVTNLVASWSTTSNTTLYVDPGTDVMAGDEITDEITGEVWSMLNASHIYALIPHISGAMRLKSSVTTSP
jgi:hypothetical protein